MSKLTNEETASQVLSLARNFIALLKDTDKELRSQGESFPSKCALEHITRYFWSFVGAMDECQRTLPRDRLMLTQKECRDITGPWFLRSRYFNRSYVKPHGYPGDYRIVEWMYDLENHDFEDITQPGIVNCLDYLFSTVHSVQSVWERRHFFSQLLTELYKDRESKELKLRILDVASGGARYIRDFLCTVKDPSTLEITLVDQDSASLNYTRAVSLVQWKDQIKTLSSPVSKVSSRLINDRFDIIISAGLFDYLPSGAATDLLVNLKGLMREEASISITNFHPSDPSRAVKEWLVDWPLIFRTQSEVESLFRSMDHVAITQSQNKALVYAIATMNRRALDPNAFLQTSQA